MIIDGLILIFISIISLFILFLVIQWLFKWRFCALCLSVSLTWLGLLLLFWLKKFNDSLLIAPLLGASLVGLYYLLEKKTKKQLHIFRLPFFLTLLFIVYLLLGAVKYYFELIILLLALWIFFGAIYIWRKNPKINKLVKRIIACCKNW